MTYLGEFAAAAQDAGDLEHDTFGWCGHEFRLRGAVSAMTVMQFAAISVKGSSIQQDESVAAVFRFLQDVIHPDDWQAFQDASREHAVEMDDYIALIRASIEAAAARPTLRPSDSPDGPPSTGASSKASSSSPGHGDLIDVTELLASSGR